mgnify:FL=1
MKFVFALLAVAACAAAAGKFATRETIEHINSVQNLWTASLESPTAHLSHEEIQALLGTDEKFAWNDPQNPPERTFSLKARAAAPESFDARTAWPQCKSMGMIRDQSDCGSCWAFGAVESMSDRECIKHGVDIILSSEDMNSCSGAGSCNGGYPSSAYHYWERTGVVTEKCVKYSLPSCDHHVPGSTNPCTGKIVPTPSCKNTCVDDPSIDFKSDKRKAASVYTVRGEENMMTELSTNGPCEGAFSVYEDFMAYTSGVYKHVTGSYEGGHAIRILGYGVDNGTKYWLIANSWNEHWGEKGYFRILRGVNECGIENMMWCGIAA